MKKDSRKLLNLQKEETRNNRCIMSLSLRLIIIKKGYPLMRTIFLEPISQICKIKTNLKEVKFKRRPYHSTMSKEIKNSKGPCLIKSKIKRANHKVLKLKVKNHNSNQKKPRSMQTNKFKFGRFHSE
jgi:hypothetical protein